LVETYPYNLIWIRPAEGRKALVTLGEYNEFCGALSYAHTVVQWGGAHVWKIDKKMFAVAGWQEQEARSAAGVTGKHYEKDKRTELQRGKGDRPSALVRRARAGAKQSEAAVSDITPIYVTFKVGEIAFEMLSEAEGCRPAPYLASRGMKWIQRTGDGYISDADLKDYLSESYRLVSLNLTKKKQKELGLNRVEDERK